MKSGSDYEAHRVLYLAVLGLPTAAFAGGFEFPDNGTEALGRGATFTAKADSPLAIEYNVGGLAQQRGTRLLFDSNLVFQNFKFQRAGTYPVENDVHGDAAAVQRRSPTRGPEPGRARSTRRSSA